MLAGPPLDGSRQIGNNSVTSASSAMQPHGVTNTVQPESAVCAASMYVWFACILKPLSVFMGGPVSVTLAGAVGSQVSEFMCYPVSERVITHIPVAVDEHASAGHVL